MSKLKIKTHSGAAKRFKPTKSGFKHRRAARSHLLTDFSAKHKRHLRHSTGVSVADTKRVTRLLLTRC